MGEVKLWILLTRWPFDWSKTQFFWVYSFKKKKKIKGKFNNLKKIFIGKSSLSQFQ